MSSLPISIFESQDKDIKLMIQEHQNFCKQLSKLHKSYVKGKTINKTEDEFLQERNKQSKEDILNWFKSLSEEERIKICTIKNKWLIDILIQLYLIYQKHDDVYIEPIYDMKDLFYSHKNICNFPNKDIFFYKNYFQILFKFPEYYYNGFNKEKEIKKEQEDYFIENVKILSLDKKDENCLDTLTLSKDIINDIQQFKNIFQYFSKDQYFQEWLLPIEVKNKYNFSLPNWMHNNDHLSLYQVIIGYLEQQIILNYEFFYYSKKLYENSYSKDIVNLYEENEKLISFVKENYSLYGYKNDANKPEFISLSNISEIVFDLNQNETIQEKIENFKKIIYENKTFFINNKNYILDKDYASKTYIKLNNELIQEGELGSRK